MFTTRTSKQAIALNKTVFRLYSTQKFSNLSQAQVQRFVNLFRAYDADQDGKLTEEDYNRLCSRFLKLAEIDKDSDDAVHLKTTFLTRWDYVKQEIDPEDKGLSMYLVLPIFFAGAKKTSKKFSQTNAFYSYMWQVCWMAQSLHCTKPKGFMGFCATNYAKALFAHVWCYWQQQ